jgi:DNA replication protein DnaC
MAVRKAGELVLAVFNENPDRTAEVEAQELQQAAEGERRLVTSALGERFAGASFANYEVYDPRQGQALKLVQAYADSAQEVVRTGRSLVLAGRSGTGKDHLVAAILRRFYQLGIASKVVRFYELTEKGMPREGQRTSWVDVVERYTRAPLLVLSEVGVQAGSAYEGRVLFHLLDTRYRELRPFILTSNLPLAELRQALDPDGRGRLWDRIEETAKVLPFTWESYRSRKHD